MTKVTSVVLLASLLVSSVGAWGSCTLMQPRQRPGVSLQALFGDYLENDLVAVQKPASGGKKDDTDSSASRPRLCVVRPDSTVAPLCQHEDDVETDLFLDPRCDSDPFWANEASDEHIKGSYGAGWFGQRPVPSLGGGPGYGAEAQEIWSIDEALLETLAEDGVDFPLLDVGIAHGEKARGGSF